VGMEMSGRLKSYRDYPGELCCAVERIDFAGHLLASHRLCRVHPVLLGLKPRVSHRIDRAARLHRALETRQQGIERRRGGKLGDCFGVVSALRAEQLAAYHFFEQARDQLEILSRLVAIAEELLRDLLRGGEIEGAGTAERLD